MKFTEKLVVIPFERYQRLINAPGPKSQKTEKEEEIEEKNTENIQKEKNTENTKKEKETENIPQTEKTSSIERGIENTPEISGSIPKISKSTVNTQIAHKPPGILNKPKNNNFKWESLF